MAELGDVLRGLGSVLNPQVAQQVAARQQAQQAQAQQMQQLMIGQVIKGVESGAIDPAKLEGTPLAGIVGQAPAVKQAVRKEAFYALPEVNRAILDGNLEQVGRAAIAAGIESDPITAMASLKKLITPTYQTIGAGGAIRTNADGTTTNVAPLTPPKLPEIGVMQNYLSTLPQGDPRRGQVESAIEKMTSPKENLSPLGKLMAERDALATREPGHPDLAQYDRVIAHANSGGGTTVINDMGLGKPAQGKVDEKLLDTTNGMMTLTRIEGQFKPQYQQFVPRVSAKWSGIKDSLGMDVSPQDKAFLAEFSAYKRNAINSLNEYIKQITGAAMSEQEAQRILKGMPNPGQGVFDGDSPTEFKSKMDDAIRVTKMALARSTYIKRNGIALSDKDGNAVISLDRMPSLMNERGKALEAQFKQAAPSATPAQIQGKVRDILANEFGLVR